MGRVELSKRKNWQTESEEKAVKAESVLAKVLSRHFEGSPYKIRLHPKELSHIYMDVKLRPEILKSIYTPKTNYRRHGIKPDFAIDNTRTDKTLYGECKRQDGWVEGKPPKAGRGNVHERFCKYFTPGLLTTLRDSGNLSENVLPFWIVFQGDITRDPKRVRELHHWFRDAVDHFYLWQDVTNEKGLIEHFDKLRHLLD